VERLALSTFSLDLSKGGKPTTCTEINNHYLTPKIPFPLLKIV
jgi:hypothetical protein